MTSRDRSPASSRRLATALAFAFASLLLAGPSHAAEGAWERAWGKDVISGNAETGFEICVVAADCQGASFGGLGGEFSAAFGVATGPAGAVYVVDSAHRVQKFDSSGNWERAWGKDVVAGNPGTGFEICTVAANCKVGVAGGLAGELDAPRAVATDASGAVYVTDGNNSRIQKFDSSGNFQQAWGRDVISGNPGTEYEVCTVAVNCKAGVVGGLGGEFNFPIGVATDAGAVYVADGSSNRIQKFDSSGTWQRAWGKDVDITPGDGFEICTVAANCKAGATGGLGGEFDFAASVATDAAGGIYASDFNNHRVQKFDSSGNWQRAWGRDVDSAAPFTGPEICTVPANCKAGIAGGLGGELNFPRGVATDAAGGVYVADQVNHRLQKFDAAGNFLRTWGKDVDSAAGIGFEICTVSASCQAGLIGGLGGEFNLPYGIATDATGSAYVGEHGGNRAQKFPGPPPSASPSPPPDGEVITARADRTVTLVANKGKVEKGRRVQLTGRIDAPANEAACEPNQTVELQRKTKTAPDSAFSTFETVQTDAGGSFAEKLKVKKTYIYRAVVSETDACDDDLSNTQKVRAQKPKAAKQA